MNKIRILLVDDHPVVRAGIEGILSSQADIEVVGEAENGEDAVHLVERLKPDLVLMDLSMPVMSGSEAIKRIKASPHPPHILVLTTYDSDRDIVPAIEAGANGYLLKDTPRAELFEAIRQTARGDSVLAPAVTTALMKRMRTPAHDQLSEREVEVLKLASHGNSNKEIGRALHISTATVKTHLIHIYEKLQVNDRTAAVTVALEQGILRLGKR